MGILGLVKRVNWTAVIHSVVGISQNVTTVHATVTKTVAMYQSEPGQEVVHEIKEAVRDVRETAQAFWQALRTLVELLWQAIIRLMGVIFSREADVKYWSTNLSP